MMQYERMAYYHTPRDDAPAYDPSLWEGKDCAYITGLSNFLAEQQLLHDAVATTRDDAARRSGHRQANSPRLSSPVGAAAGLGAYGGDGVVPASLSTARVANFHTLPHTGSTSFSSRLIRYLIPRYYARQQTNLSQRQLAELTSQELLSLMRTALAAGERERSSLIANELSRRRVTVDLQEQGTGQAGANVPIGSFSSIGSGVNKLNGNRASVASPAVPPSVLGNLAGTGRPVDAAVNGSGYNTSSNGFSLFNASAVSGPQQQQQQQSMNGSANRTRTYSAAATSGNASDYFAETNPSVSTASGRLAGGYWR